MMGRDEAQLRVIRTGGPTDLPLLTALFDEAIDWLLARGQTGQWGTGHAAERPETLRRFATFAASGGLRIAEHDGMTEGALVLGQAPSYVPTAPERELYVLLLLSSRQHTGEAIGARLIRRAAREASQAGCRQLRVDCWAQAPSLVDWYQNQGFTPDGTFALNGWQGQILNMPLT